ncbi:hypothetical protein ACVH9Z_40565 [Rhodococcus opacus]|uniref:hypothetical protein n=1 Tax=Rhodococcus opacus TaxID=37919 RepID=UPI0002A1EF91|nr:hypothetical protein [Rhodococcus opacus]ELB90033.1 hypothetical protein Rwratislav_26414 [Rhodococcus wratislaviensis IFP 2016]WKN59853.1 hypothetical protein HJ581_0039020 [Rhodococcus opacus]
MFAPGRKGTVTAVSALTGVASTNRPLRSEAYVGARSPATRRATNPLLLRHWYTHTHRRRPAKFVQGASDAALGWLLTFQRSYRN